MPMKKDSNKFLENREGNCSEKKRVFLYENDARFILFSLLLITYISLVYSSIYLLSYSILFTFFFFYMIYKKQRSFRAFFLLSSFCFFWGLMTVFIKSINYTNGFYFSNIKENFEFAYLFVLQLYFLGLVGLTTYNAASAKDYALAITWFFSFFSKKHAWKMGLVLLLVLKSFYDILKLGKEIKASVKYRLRNQNTFRQKIMKIFIFMQMLMNALARRNYELSMAIHLKGLNNKKAFTKEWGSFFSLTYLKKNLNYLIFLLISFVFLYLTS